MTYGRSSPVACYWRPLSSSAWRLADDDPVEDWLTVASFTARLLVVTYPKACNLQKCQWTQHCVSFKYVDRAVDDPARFFLVGGKSSNDLTRGSISYWLRSTPFLILLFELEPRLGSPQLSISTTTRKTVVKHLNISLTFL